LIFTSVLFGWCNLAMGQFAPPAGQTGTTAMHADSSAFIGWATNCVVQRGPMDITDPTLGFASAGDPAFAIGNASGTGVVSLGDGGVATLTFALPIVNGPGPDFAVFENAFLDTFLELAFVEVSSDGQKFVRFPATSLTPAEPQIDGFGAVDATKIHNLAGKYRVFYGTPFDLEDLRDSIGIDIQKITHVRIVDVIGCIQPAFASFDAGGRIINDPWNTPFPSSGFDLDAVGVIHHAPLNDFQFARAQPSIQAVPNPMNRRGNIIMKDLEGRTCDIYVTNIAGQQVTSRRIIPDQELLYWPISNLDLGSGIYIVTVVSEALSYKIKIVIHE
jgi:hypothetical protein